MDFCAAGAFEDRVLEFRVYLLFHFLFSGGKLKQFIIAHKFGGASVPIVMLRASFSLVHYFKELPIGVGLHDFVQEEFHSIHGVHVRQEFPQQPDPLEILFGDKQFFFTCSGPIDVNAREDAAFQKPPIEVYLHIARAFEFFVYYLVHLAARVDERCGDNGQAPPLFDVSGRAEKSLGTLQRVGIHTT